MLRFSTEVDGWRRRRGGVGEEELLRLVDERRELSELVHVGLRGVVCGWVTAKRGRKTEWVEREGKDERTTDCWFSLTRVGDGLMLLLSWCGWAMSREREEGGTEEGRRGKERKDVHSLRAAVRMQVEKTRQWEAQWEAQWEHCFVLSHRKT
jgi:hypothetical protein